MSDAVRLRTGDSTILPKIIEGLSPEVELTQQTGGVLMTVTTKSGTKSALIPVGPTGPEGPMGPQGLQGVPGPAGANYELTDADIEEIKDAYDDVKSAVQGYARNALRDASIATVAASDANNYKIAAAASATAAAGNQQTTADLVEAARQHALAAEQSKSDAEEAAEAAAGSESAAEAAAESIEELVDGFDETVQTAEAVIDGAKTSALGDIASRETLAQESISAAATEALGAITDTLEDIADAKEEALGAITETFETITDAKTDALADIANAKNGALGNISDAETTALGDIADAKSDIGDSVAAAAASATDAAGSATAAAESATDAAGSATDAAGSATDAAESAAAAAESAQALEDIIDDTAGEGDVTKVWSADKTDTELSSVKSAINDAGLIEEVAAVFSVEGIFLSPSNGKANNYYASTATDFIPITGETIKYSLNGNNSTGLICFYTTNTESGFISSVSGNGTTIMINTGEVEVPETAKYYRAAAWLYDTVAGQYATQRKINNLEEFDERLRATVENVQSNTIELAKRLENYQEPSKPFPNNGYIALINGSFVANENANTTEYIPIESGVVAIDFYLTHANNGAMVAFYSNPSPSGYISGVEGVGENLKMEKGTATIPHGANYYRAMQWILPGVTDYYVRKRYSIKAIAEAIGASGTIVADTITLQLMESINKPFDFSNKKITAFGDSITQGVGSPNLQQVTPYIRHFADHVMATLNNKAISGQCIASDNQYSIYNRVAEFSDATDFIVIAGGTNDFVTNVSLGTFASTAGTDTFYGALKGICETLATNYPSTPVIWITPIPFTNRDPNIPNTAGYTLNQYRQAIYEIGTLYGHSVVNGASLGMPTEQGGWGNAMCDDTDGCHPTAEGHKLYARSLAGKLL